MPIKELGTNEDYHDTGLVATTLAPSSGLREYETRRPQQHNRFPIVFQDASDLMPEASWNMIGNLFCCCTHRRPQHQRHSLPCMDKATIGTFQKVSIPPLSILSEITCKSQAVPASILYLSNRSCCCLRHIALVLSTLNTAAFQFFSVSMFKIAIAAVTLSVPPRRAPFLLAWFQSGSHFHQKSLYLFRIAN